MGRVWARLLQDQAIEERLHNRLKGCVLWETHEQSNLRLLSSLGFRFIQYQMGLGRHCGSCMVGSSMNNKLPRLLSTSSEIVTTKLGHTSIQKWWKFGLD